MRWSFVIVFFLFLFFFVTPKAAEAQYCGGYVPCYQYVPNPSHCQLSGTLNCNNVTAPCNTGDTCIAGVGGQWVYSSTQSCTGIIGGTDPTICNSTTITCTGSDGNPTHLSCGWVGASPPPPTGNAGGGGCGQVCSSNSDCLAGLQCDSVQHVCWGGACGGPGPTAPPNYDCGHSCNSDSDCRNPSAAGVQTACRGGQCVNLACYEEGGTTVPGANCDCSGSPRQCGETCGASVGLCSSSSNSTCAFITGNACTGSDTSNPIGTVCVPNSITNNSGAPSGWASAVCSSGGNKYVTDNGSNPTVSQVQSVCPCVTPDPVSAALGYYTYTSGSGTLNGATVNAAYSTDGGGNQSYGVTITWDASLQGGYGWAPEANMPNEPYDVEIVPEGQENACANPNSPSDPNAVCVHNTTIRFADYTFAPHYNGRYEARVRAYNPSCGLSSAWTPWSHFTVTGLPVTGTVYLDSNLYSEYSSQTNSCYSTNLSSLNTAPSGKLLIVGAPGLLGQYYNENDTNFTTTPRTRYDGPTSSGTFQWPAFAHNLFYMPGSQDGPGAVAWTATVMPTTTGSYSFQGPVSQWDTWGTDQNATQGDVSKSYFEAWVNGNIVACLSSIPGLVCDQSNPIPLTAGQQYSLKMVYYTNWYVNALYMPSVFWNTDTVAGMQPGSGSTVSSQDLGSNTSGSGSVGSNGQFSINQEYTGSGVLDLSPGNTAYTCVCPVGICSYSQLGASLNGQQNLGFGKDFYVTQSPSAWWNILGGGDALTNGAIQSKVPAATYFIGNGSGGTPGNAIYGGTTNLTTGNVSSTGWNSNSPYQGKTYDSNYFNSLISGNVTWNKAPAVMGQSDFDGGTISSDGYYWFKTTGNTAINSNITVSGSKKFILFVNGSLSINGNINIANHGQGFFMVIVSGNINVAGTVTAASGPALEGIYETDGIFDTGLSFSSLYIRGSVVAWSGFNLRRNLLAGNSSSPAETVEYAPELTMLFPRGLEEARTTWQEVVP